MSDTGAVGIIGPGRAGAGLALALHETGGDVRLHGRQAKRVPLDVQLTLGSEDAPPPWIGDVDVIVCAVRDDAVRNIAEMLARHEVVGAHQTVLHLSGCWGRELLEALQPTGASLGSLHFLQTISDPETAPQHLRGAYAAVEGDDRAVDVASAVARRIGLIPVRITSDRKPLYHTAAVFASNYAVVLASVAERVARASGMPEDHAWDALRPLIQGSLANLLDAERPGEALTGPIARGDDRTVGENLRRLEGADARLYALLGTFALDIAEADGLDPVAVRRLRSVLSNDSDSLGG